MISLIKTLWSSKWGLTLSIGILLGLSFPPVPLPFLIIPAFFLLFRLIDLCSSAKAAAYRVYPAFVIWNIITTYWLIMATVAGGIAAILANAAVMTLPVMLQYYAQKQLNRWWWTALLQSAFWVSYEYLHHHWDLAWPWLALGNAWSNVPELVQYISVTGYLGISFWIVLVASLSYQWWKTNHKRAGYTAVAAALVMPLISLIQLSTTDTVNNLKNRKTSDVVVVQPNFDSYHPYGGYRTPKEAVDVLRYLSDSVRTKDTDLIVWPENAIHPSLHSKTLGENADRTKFRLRNLAAKWDITLLGGATYFEYYSSGNPPRLPRGTNSNPHLVFNSAVGFYPDSTFHVYRKYNLVPIVERIPFVHFLNRIDIFNWVNWSDIQGYGKGKKPDQFLTNGTKTPALICYDSVFPGWVRAFVNDGAGFITIITNDGWWGNTSGHTQHFAYARLRALEFRRWVVRSANNGISGIIAPNGTIRVKTSYWTQTAFSHKVPVLNQQTLYARFGDWLPVSLLIGSVIGIIYIIFFRLK